MIDSFIIFIFCTRVYPKNHIQLFLCLFSYSLYSKFNPPPPSTQSCNLLPLGGALGVVMAGSIIRANNNHKKDDGSTAAANGSLAPQRRLLQEVEARVQNRCKSRQYDHSGLG